MIDGLRSLGKLSEGQYSSIGRTVCLLTTIEYELFRAISVSDGITEGEMVNAARGTFDQRKTMFCEKLKDDSRLRRTVFDKLVERLETASELRGQFAHGLWVVEGEQLVCKFIKRNTRGDNTRHIALQTVEMPPEKFALIERNLEYILVELDVIQELLRDS